MTTTSSKFGKLSKSKNEIAPVIETPTQTDIPQLELEAALTAIEDVQAPKPRAFDGSEVTEERGEEEKIEVLEEVTPKRGRPATGKRSSGEFKRVTVYLSKSTLREAKRKLFDQERDDFETSELLEEALRFWIANT